MESILEPIIESAIRNSTSPQSFLHLVGGGLVNGIAHPLFSGTILIGILGFILHTAKAFVVDTYYWFTSQFIVRLELNSKDESFRYLLQWMGEHNKFKKSRNMTCATIYPGVDGGRHYRGNGDEEVKPEFVYSPAPGVHVTSFKGNWVQMQRIRDKSTINLGGTTRDVISSISSETLVLTARNAQTLFDLLEEAKSLSLDREHDKTAVYIVDYDCWRKSTLKTPRPMKSIVLDVGLSDRIVNDAKQFFASKDWYIETGIPHRRGYLFYGPPGCGKTSLVQGLAGSLHMGLCTLSLASGGMDDNRLNSLFNDAPINSIILIEDIDCAFDEKRKHGSGASDRLTFSGLLNCIDGVASQEGRVLILTTNYIEKLDSALLRPGRCDRRFEFKKSTHSQIRGMFKRFYPETEDKSLGWIKDIPEYTISPAEVQGVLLKNRYDADQARVELLGHEVEKATIGMKKGMTQTTMDSFLCEKEETVAVA